MSYKNILSTCASAAALALALAHPLYAEEETSETATPQPREKVAAPMQISAPAPAEAPSTVEPPGIAAASAPDMMKPPVPPMMEPPVPPKSPTLPPEIAQKQAEREQAMAEKRARQEKWMAMSPEERWESRRSELNARYQDLRARASEAGVQLPEMPPWERERQWMSYEEMRSQMQQQGVNLPEQPAWPPGRGPGMGRGMGPGRMLMTEEERTATREALAQMTPEERAAFHEQHYQELRVRAKDQGMELPETPPWTQAPVLPEPPAEPDWARIQESIAGMTPEEREACMFMQRMNMPPRLRPTQRPMGTREGTPGYGYAPGYGRGPGYGQGQAPGYGYGYGRGQGYGPRRGQWSGYPE